MSIAGLTTNSSPNRFKKVRRSRLGGWARFQSGLMLIGGLEKLTVIDFPGEIAAIIFTQGCNFRCHFCYNPMLVLPAKTDGKVRYSSQEEAEDHLLKEDDLFAFLESRRGKLDGVVITGGEPTLHADLPEFIERIRALGYKVKLDTNGTNPEMLARLIGAGLLDYIAMDIKAPRERYGEVVGVQLDFSRIEKSIKIIMESGRPYEFRTTVVPDLLDGKDIARMGEMIRGAEKWFLQAFKSETELVDRNFMGRKRYAVREMEELADTARKFVAFCQVR